MPPKGKGIPPSISRTTEACIQNTRLRAKKQQQRSSPGPSTPNNTFHITEEYNAAWSNLPLTVGIHSTHADGSFIIDKNDVSPSLTKWANSAFTQGVNPNRVRETINAKPFKGPADNLASPDTPTKKNRLTESVSNYSPTPSVTDSHYRHPETPTTPPNPPSESDYEETPRPIPRAPEVLDDSEMSEGGEESELELDPTALLLKTILNRIMTLEKRSKTPPSPTKYRNDPALVEKVATLTTKVAELERTMSLRPTTLPPPRATGRPQLRVLLDPDF
ncbi:hypothetical protein Q9L58_010511 [Maublancomyces gigas]|uniref:Uncharacterized protein n=1 Tax=Discina gigas TaxID=1032678 RepID=A0ABR3G4C7_9PEZI